MQQTRQPVLRDPLDVVAVLLAVSQVEFLVPASPWLLHQAVRALHKEAAQAGRLSELPELHFRACASVGVRVEGLDEAMLELRRIGALNIRGHGESCLLDVDRSRLAASRRALMRLEPETTRLVQRAGARLAASTATTSKNLATPAESAGSLRVPGATN